MGIRMRQDAERTTECRSGRHALKKGTGTLRRMRRHAGLILSAVCMLLVLCGSGRLPEETPGDYAMLSRPGRYVEHYRKLTEELEAHTVEEGDSLWKIAMEVYGDGGMWTGIAAQNGLENPSLIYPGQRLALPDRVFYLQKPWMQRGKGHYMEDMGAFRFEIPEGDWAFGTCSLDARLSTFSGSDRRARVLWGVEDNEMGEDAWSESWDSVCVAMEQTAQTVFGDALEELSFEKYRVEDGREVYAFCCVFTDQEGARQVVSAAYRFGKKNLMEFIGLGPAEFVPDIGRLTLYTAVTYEEYEEERHMGFGEKNGEYRGMEVWAYPQLHNPFVLAWEYANDSAWRLKKEPEAMEEDFVIAWKEPVLPAILKKALDLEGDIHYSDLLQIETLEALECAGYDFCSVNGVRYETDWKAIGSGDALVEDIACLGGLCALRMQIGDITELSALERLTALEELEIWTGQQAQTLQIPQKLRNLKRCVVEKAPLQDYVDCLDGALGERTRRELGITTFVPFEK